MRICYTDKQFTEKTLAVIRMAENIMNEYALQGYSLTLRQLYYQFVARDLLPNTQRSYDRLGRIINDGRMAGLLDWDAIEDRTRNFEELAHWSSPASVIRSAAHSYHRDLWEGQEVRVEVWVEKEALAGVIERTCSELDIPWFACRGYVSQSEQWRAGQRIVQRNVPTVILHLGDHDPSGIDMSRDNNDRLQMFAQYDGVFETEVVRIALNMDQIDELNPPENPAKLSDSRAEDYIRKFGYSSWELDALPPTYIDSLIRINVDTYRDVDLFDEQFARQEEERRLLALVSENWKDVAGQFIDE